ncbi:lipoprotein, partial [Borreliella garinii]
MRSMKTLLRLLGAVSLTTVAASSVVACGSKAPEIHDDVAK